MRTGKDRESSKRKREKERQRETDYRSERLSIGEIQNWRGFRNDHWKKIPEYFK